MHENILNILTYFFLAGFFTGFLAAGFLAAGFFTAFLVLQHVQAI